MARVSKFKGHQVRPSAYITTTTTTTTTTCKCLSHTHSSAALQHKLSTMRCVASSPPGAAVLSQSSGCLSAAWS
ncbi:hypothetical protein O3P69_012315 [Scylla paramamosain]|uniref:Uncharacterized protein n=1 Tax=Scylla paramamosain TaxID=85552 RepID=A0AAW0TFL4_SCYPA